MGEEMVAVRITAALRQRAKMLAVQRNVSLQQIVTDAVEAFLAQSTEQGATPPRSRKKK